MASVIALKGSPHPHRVGMGKITPYLKEENGEFVASKSEDFPNSNSIVIFRDYNELDDEFDQNELFKIEYREAERIGRYDPDDPNYSQYQVKGNAKALNKWEIFHIVDKGVDYEERKIHNLPYKPTREVFIQRDQHPDYLFGPFNYTSEQNIDGDYTVFLEPYHRIKRVDSSSNWFILKINKAEFDIVKIGEQKVWACSMDNLADANYEIIDFISNGQLIKWANDIIPPTSRITKRELTDFRTAIEKMPQLDSKITTDRKKRVLDIFEKLDMWKDSRAALIGQFLLTEQGKKSINQYLDTNRKTFEQELEALYSDKEAVYRQESSKLDKELEDKGKELEKLKSELEEANEKINERQQQKLDRQSLKLKEEVQELHTERDSLANQLNMLNKISDLEDEKKFLERTTEDLKKNTSKLEDLKGSLSREVQANQNELLKKLTDLKPFVDILNGLEIHSDEIEQKMSILEPQNAPDTLEEFIDEIQKNLKANGRDYDKESLANYLISIHQSFFTIFAGLPGIGKTSLITYLSKSLGMDQNKRFLFIPVARGWTSQKNLLGFFNPLNGKFQPSTTGMYEALTRIQNDAPDYPYWFLLDEANLSPIEHYWSSFMAMCDEHREKILNIKHSTNNNLRVPDSVRFIATINNDNTTELLSPRIIDRAPIITISDGGSQSNTNHSTNPEMPVTSIIPQDELNKLFKPKEEGFDTDEERVFNDIEKCLSEQSSPDYLLPIIISPRKRNMIEAYCAVARDIMSEGNYNLRAIDIAISQHILPLINGNGKAYRKRLDKLEQLLDDKTLTHSHSMLRKIIAVGESQYDFYRFFM